MGGNSITSCQQNLCSEKNNSVSGISSLVRISCKGKNNFNILKRDENIANSFTSHFNCSEVL